MKLGPYLPLSVPLAIDLEVGSSFGDGEPYEIFAADRFTSKQ